MTTTPQQSYTPVARPRLLGARLESPAPRSQLNTLNDTPIAELQAPAPSGAQTSGFAGARPSGAAAGVAARLAERLGRNDLATDEIARTAQFTMDGLERKNQERVKAFVEGPVFPTGSSSGAGANTMRPFTLAPFNRERLNAGEVVRPELGAPYLRSIGSAWGDRVNASNWAAMTEVITQMANTDPAGFAQTNYTGTMIADRNTSYQPQRGFKPGGPLYGVGGNGGGDPNAGAAYGKTDGAGAGIPAQLILAERVKLNGAMAFSMQKPSGAGALAVPQAYGLSALLGGP